MSDGTHDRVPLNARVTASLRRAFDVEVARRGLKKQEAVEKALTLWMAAPAAGPEPGELPPFPVVHSRRKRGFTVTREQTDEAMLG